MEINPNEEQVAEPSSGEEKETSKEEQVTKPSDSRERYEKFKENAAEKKEAKSKETSKEKEPPPEKETGEKKVEDSKPKGPKIRFVDEQGNDVSFVLDVDGKPIEIKDPDELKTKGQIWYHHDIKGKELNELKEKLEAIADQQKAKESDLQTGAEQIAKIMEAIEKRGSQSAPQKPSDEEQVEEEDDFDESLLDPDTLKRFKKLEKRVETAENESKMTKQMLFKMMVTDEGSKIDGEIKELQGDSFSEKKRKKVYRLLAENDDKTGKPKYKNVKEAVEAEKKEREEDLKEYLEKNPEILEMKKKDREEAVAEYLEAKEKDEEAPVSPPSETPVDELASAPEKKKKKEGYGSIMAAAEAGMKSIAERRGIARKH
ncbi:MAG TPA: hypothetical protein VMW25_03045 [Clostridia bacterium]|nr:hypothetical protein [Clostridia bacterium]